MVVLNKHYLCFIFDFLSVKCCTRVPDQVTLVMVCSSVQCSDFRKSFSIVIFKCEIKLPMWAVILRSILLSNKNTNVIRRKNSLLLSCDEKKGTFTLIWFVFLLMYFIRVFLQHNIWHNLSLGICHCSYI